MQTRCVESHLGHRSSEAVMEEGRGSNDACIRTHRNRLSLICGLLVSM
jgi:hypothetical protein